MIVLVVVMMFSFRSGGLGSWESDDDANIDDEDSVVAALGCLGPLGGLLAPELQRYQKHLKGQCSHTISYTGFIWRPMESIQGQQPSGFRLTTAPHL